MWVQDWSRGTVFVVLLYYRQRLVSLGIDYACNPIVPSELKRPEPARTCRLIYCSQSVRLSPFGLIGPCVEFVSII
jgi:hypothetical protein